MRNPMLTQNDSVVRYRSLKKPFAAALVVLAVTITCVLTLRAVKIRDVGSLEQREAASSASLTDTEKPLTGLTKPTAVPRLERSRRLAGGPIDGERAELTVDGHLGSNEPRPAESPMSLKTRQRFNREYQSFVERAGLSPEQELRLRQASMRAQLTRTKLNEQADEDLVTAARDAQRAGQPAPLQDFTELSRQEKSVQSELDVSVAEILTLEQLGMLRERKQFITLRHIASLGSEPFEIATSR